jgi:aspartate kinase
LENPNGCTPSPASSPRTTPAKLVVLSAVSGTTNSLIEIGDLIGKGDPAAATAAIDKLHGSYQAFIGQLYGTPEGLAKGQAVVTEHFDFIRSLTGKPYGVKESKELVAEGELISTQLFIAYLHETGVNAALLPALDFMRIDADEEPVLDFTERELGKALAAQPDVEIFITQGYICRNPGREIDNLKRGGSDYTASLVGAAIRSEEVQIWTDISRHAQQRPPDREETLSRLPNSPSTRQPNWRTSGPKSCTRSASGRPSSTTFPCGCSTRCSPKPAAPSSPTPATEDRDIKAIAAKDGITAIRIQSSRMLLAYGFLTRVFEVFQRFKTPIDVITTSEVAVSLTIDNPAHLDEIVNELKAFSRVEVDRDLTHHLRGGQLQPRPARHHCPGVQFHQGHSGADDLFRRQRAQHFPAGGHRKEKRRPQRPQRRPFPTGRGIEREPHPQAPLQKRGELRRRFSPLSFGEGPGVRSLATLRKAYSPLLQKAQHLPLKATH